MRVSRRGLEAPSPNMTPMIDCVFQLLIFFLTTASLSQMAMVHLFLPVEKGNPAASTGSAGLVVNLTAGGALVVSNREVTLSEIAVLAREAIAREPEAVPVIRADRAVMNLTMLIYHGKKYDLRQMEPAAAAFREACAPLWGQFADRDDATLATLAAELVRQSVDLHLALYDEGFSLRLVPALSPGALEAERTPDETAQPWLSFQALVFGSDAALAGYPRPELREVREAFEEVRSAYLDRRDPDRARRFNRAMPRFAAAVHHVQLHARHMVKFAVKGHVFHIQQPAHDLHCLAHRQQRLATLDTHIPGQRVPPCANAADDAVGSQVVEREEGGRQQANVARPVVDHRRADFYSLRGGRKSRHRHNSIPHQPALSLPNSLEALALSILCVFDPVCQRMSVLQIKGGARNCHGEPPELWVR